MSKPRQPILSYIPIKMVKELKVSDAELKGTSVDLDGTKYVTVVFFGKLPK